MDRSSIIRVLVIVGLALFGMLFVYPRACATSSKLQPLDVVDQTALPRDQRAEELFCEISGPRFHAATSTRGASLKSFVLTDEKYQRQEKGKPILDADGNTIP